MIKKILKQKCDSRPKSSSYSTYLKKSNKNNTNSLNSQDYISNYTKDKNTLKIDFKQLHVGIKRKRINSLSQENIKLTLNKPKAKEKIKPKINSQSKKDISLTVQKYDPITQNNKKNGIKIINNINFKQQRNKSQQHRKNNSSLNINSSFNIAQKQKRSQSSMSITKQQSSQTSVFETIQQLNQIKFKYSYRTKQGILVTNPNKTNQDSLLIKQHLTKRNNKDIHLFAIADGHGMHGHLVSQCIVKNMPQIFQRQIKKQNVPHKALSKTYEHLQHILTYNSPQINISCSGSTLVTILIQGNTIICSNVGDSRAILARQVDKKCWEMIYLSEDHKPSLQRQKKRIIKSGGKVYAFKDQNNRSVGPLRVWLPNQKLQGLAMSRSLGDNISKPIGVTYQPQHIKIQLQQRDKFLLLASDGIWQFITNQQVLQLLVPYYKQNKLQQACDALLKLAYDKWTVDDISVVDDISFILIFFFK